MKIHVKFSALQIMVLCSIHLSIYSKKGMSASFLGVLDNESFFTIDHIIIKDSIMLCVCTELRKLRNVIDEIKDNERLELLGLCCPTFDVKYGSNV